MARKPDLETEILIDNEPENAKDILRAARAFVRAKAAHEGTKETLDAKRDLLVRAIVAANVTPLEDGTISFPVDGLRIKLKPGTPGVSVKGADEEGGDDD